MAAIFMSSLQNLSPLPTSLKVKPLLKPKTGLNFYRFHQNTSFTSTEKSGPE